jgi:N-acetylneuraminate lyase
MAKRTPHPLTGLVVATHTPFDRSGKLNLLIVEKQAAHLLRIGLSTVFIGGSTGESHSLTHEERLALAQRWSDVARGTSMRVIVHVGSNCLSDARALAAQAQKLGALAVSSLAPSYFKPRNVQTLVDCCAEIASACPATPFYFYDIPVLTGVQLSMPDFLDAAAARIPTLAGLKFTNPDLMAYQLCLHSHDGAFDVPWGIDECMLAALAVGAQGAVGSGYNFAAPIHQRMLGAFAAGDFATARKEQYRSVQLVQLLSRYGYMGAAKAVMGMLGVEVGPARLPHTNPTPDQAIQLRADLERLGFFDWIKAV